MRANAGRLALSLAVASTTILAAGGAAGGEIASHRAVYSMRLGTASYGSNVAEMSGQLALEVAEACDGWTLEQRTARRIVTPDGTEVRTLSAFSSWESKDGARFRFVQRIRRGGQTVEELGGRAVMAGAKGGMAYFTKPEEVEIPLPPGTLFPFEHTARLLARAEAGESHFVAVVFDGSALENPNRVSAFIGPRTELPGLTEGSGPQATWPVRLAFFPLDRNVAEPDVEIGLLLQADGVARELDLDYGTFTVRGTLDRFEPVPPIRC